MVSHSDIRGFGTSPYHKSSIRAELPRTINASWTLGSYRKTSSRILPLDASWLFFSNQYVLIHSLFALISKVQFVVIVSLSSFPLPREIHTILGPPQPRLFAQAFLSTPTDGNVCTIDVEPSRPSRPSERLFPAVAS